VNERKKRKKSEVSKRVMEMPPLLRRVIIRRVREKPERRGKVSSNFDQKKRIG